MTNMATFNDTTKQIDLSPDEQELFDALDEEKEMRKMDARDQAQEIEID